jgi:hypothetical protein
MSKGDAKMSGNTHKPIVGYTLYKPTGVQHEYPYVDLVKMQVTCCVIYKEKTYMTVMVDVKSDNLEVQGDVKELGDLSMDRNSYLDMFKHQARFFINNNISDPKKYYDELIHGQK